MSGLDPAVVTVLNSAWPLNVPDLNYSNLAVSTIDCIGHRERRFNEQSTVEKRLSLRFGIQGKQGIAILSAARVTAPRSVDSIQMLASSFCVVTSHVTVIRTWATPANEYAQKSEPTCNPGCWLPYADGILPDRSAHGPDRKGPECALRRAYHSPSDCSARHEFRLVS